MSSIRLTGLASGIDTESMIKELMKAERTRVDRVEQDKQKLQWKQELYNSLNKDFANFILNTKKEFGLTRTSSTGALFDNSLSSLSWVKKDTSSNSIVASVSSTAKAVNGSYAVNVNRVADGVKAASGASISKSEDKTTLASQFDIAANSEIKFTINDKEIVANSDESINDVIKRINSADAGVQASYDASIDRFFIQTTSTGESAQLKIDSSDANGVTFIDALKLNTTSYSQNIDTGEWEQSTGSLTIGNAYAGVNALIDFAGATGIEQSSNQFTINGINFNISSEGTTTVTVGTDTDAAYDKIKVFVEKYNELVDKTSKLLGEKQYRDFTPLTKEQKEAMSEEEIELWEEKAKSGLLRNDSIISSTMQKIRGSLYQEVEGVENGSFNTLYKIGITTERWAAGVAGGRLEIDEEKLKKAITDDVDGVLELLFKETDKVIKTDGDGTPITDKDGNPVTEERGGGVITRMYNLMTDGMKEVINKAGPGAEASLYRNVNSNMLLDFISKHSSISMLDEDIKDMNVKIDDLNRYLLDIEDKYYRQFSAMEQYIQQMNNQSSWIAQQLGGM